MKNFPKVQNVKFSFPLSLLIIPSHHFFSLCLSLPMGLIVYCSSQNFSLLFTCVASLFFSQTLLRPNRLATIPSARRDQNANTNASNPELTVTIQVPTTMTPEQTDLIFELTRRKLEEEIVAAEVEARLRREMMVKESEPRVAA